MQTGEPSYYDLKHINRQLRTLLDALASQIAVSLENTRLIEKATRAEWLSAGRSA